MDPQRVREIASLGGRAVHAKGTAHEFTSEEARAAGKRGGVNRAERWKAKRDAELAAVLVNGQKEPE